MVVDIGAELGSAEDGAVDGEAVEDEREDEGMTDGSGAIEDWMIDDGPIDEEMAEDETIDEGKMDDSGAMEDGTIDEGVADDEIEDKGMDVGLQRLPRFLFFLAVILAGVLVAMTVVEAVKTLVVV